MPEFFIGSQPIYDRGLGVDAYELLYRGETTGDNEIFDGNKATSQVILNAFVEIGIDELVGPHRAFINLTRDVLLQETPVPFPKNKIVLEILEDIEIDEQLIASVRELSSLGYTIALDDFVYTPEWQPLVEIADIIKLDILALGRQQTTEHVRRLREYKCMLLAEKVETARDYALANNLGFDYYQGYFFSKPNIVSGQRLPENRMAALNLLARLNDPNSDIHDLDVIISQDVSLSYKMLRYINSAFFNLKRRVASISEAIVLIGLNQIRTWTSLLVMSGLGDKPRELLNTALVRGRMCQLLAQATGRNDPGSYFTTGLLSTLDALMDAPMEEIISALPLSDELLDALLHHSGERGFALECALAFEQCEPAGAQWRGLDVSMLSRIYADATAWAFQAQADLNDNQQHSPGTAQKAAS